MAKTHGIAPITNLEDARFAWDSFFGRFYSPEIPEGVDVSFNPILTEFHPRKNVKAKDQSPNKLEGRTLHSDDFDDFLNGNIITIPKSMKLTAKGLEQVAHAIEEGNYAHPALKKESHVFYALWLFKQNRISRQQMTTILARNQIPKEYPLVKTFAILDEKGQFTPEAMDMLIPCLESNTFGGKFTATHLKRLRLLLQAAPKSEQIFFISTENPEIINPEWKEQKKKGTRTLGSAMYDNYAWYQTTYKNKIYDLHFSLALTEGLQISKKGIQGAAASRAKIGKVSIDSVKEGVEYYYRPTAISIPNSGVEAVTKDIHNYPDSPLSTTTAHDVYHSRVQNTLPPEFNMMLNHMNQIISKHTKQKWSKTMWELVDREFLPFLRLKLNLNEDNGAELFVRMLHKSDKSSDKQSDRPLIFRESTHSKLAEDTSQLNEEGFAIVWNMVTQSGIWKKLYKVDVDKLPNPYKPLVEKIKAFKDHVGENHKYTPILNLKYYLFKMTNPSEFKTMCTILDSIQEELIHNEDQKLFFGKHTHKNEKNITALKIKNPGDKDLVIYEDTVKHVLPLISDIKLKSFLGEKNEEVVKTEVKKIANEFRSMYENSGFTKELLDKTLSTFANTTQKLDFLELCYEQIVSTKYTRRHAMADSLFSFFKSPLTTSQREHILLLQENAKTLLESEKRSIKPEQATEFDWCVQNRKSNLMACNINRFLINSDSDATVPRRPAPSL